MINEEAAYNKATNHLICELGIDTTDKREVEILQRAIHYANITDYTEDARGTDEHANNEIFYTKAISYFRRKRLNPFEDTAKIKEIYNWEHYTITNIKFKNQL